VHRGRAAFVTTWIAAVTAMAALPIAGASLSHAADQRATRIVLDDDTQDVWRINGPGDAGPATRPRRTVDIERARIAHRRWAIAARVTFVNLRRVNLDQSVRMDVEVPGNTFWPGVSFSPAHRSGRHYLSASEGGEISCPAMSHVVDYAEDRVVLRIPRTCLDRPRWARVHLNTSALPNEGDDNYVLVDNPHNSTNEYELTGRLYRASP
jgi:hypothetical protein